MTSSAGTSCGSKIEMRSELELGEQERDLKVQSELLALSRKLSIDHPVITKNSICVTGRIKSGTLAPVCGELLILGKSVIRHTHAVALAADMQNSAIRP